MTQHRAASNCVTLPIRYIGPLVLAMANCLYHCKCQINRCENLHIGNQGYYSVAVNWKTCTHTCSSCFKTPLYCFACFMRQAPKHDACCQCQYHLGPDLMNKEPTKNLSTILLSELKQKTELESSRWS